MLQMWVFHVRLLKIVTPKYLASLVTTYQKEQKMNWKEYRGEQHAFYLVDTIAEAAYPT
jgi:hypothetical protein